MFCIYDDLGNKCRKYTNLRKSTNIFEIFLFLFFVILCLLRNFSQGYGISNTTPICFHPVAWFWNIASALAGYSFMEDFYKVISIVRSGAHKIVVVKQIYHALNFFPEAFGACPVWRLV